MRILFVHVKTEFTFIANDLLLLTSLIVLIHFVALDWLFTKATTYCCIVALLTVLVDFLAIKKFITPGAIQYHPRTN